MTREQKIALSELDKIPFVDAENLGSRVLTSLTFFREGEWQMWIPSPTGLLPIAGQPSEADYFGQEPEGSTDIYLDFLNFMTQRACWPETVRFVSAIRRDIHNLGASLAKLDLFHRSSTDNHVEVARFVSTEVEYIFVVCRGVFDLLQELIARFWQTRVEFPNMATKKKQLKKSFAGMVMKKGRLSALEEIEERFQVPRGLASFYYRNGPFFKMVRDYRDSVVHGGTEFTPFVTPRGFAVFAHLEPFASLGVWNEEHMLPNRLASLRPVVASVISQTLQACEDFSQTIQQVITFPPPVVPDFRLFVRGHYNRQLLWMKDVLADCSWWDTKYTGQEGKDASA
jgi:hypothetical protein